MRGSISIQSLVGRKVLGAFINIDNDEVVLITNRGSFLLRWWGDCCAECFLQHVEGTDALIGGTIQQVEQSEWIRKDLGDFEVTEQMGTQFITDKGYVKFETRLNHNGYYGGDILIEAIKEVSSPDFRILGDF